MANGYGEPWRFEPEDENHFGIVTDGGGVTVFSWDGMDADRFYRLAARAAKCVNALAGVPDAALANPTDAQRFALAVLRGDADALILTDYLQEHHTAEQAAARAGKRFVSRGELLNLLTEITGGFDHQAYLGWVYYRHQRVPAATMARWRQLIRDAGG